MKNSELTRPFYSREKKPNPYKRNYDLAFYLDSVKQYPILRHRFFELLTAKEIKEYVEKKKSQITASEFQSSTKPLTARGRMNQKTD